MSTVRIQLRRGTSTEWATADAIGAGVILAAGEVGFVTDENTFKVGDGSANFGDLPYILESSLGDYIPLSQFGTPSGVATLDSSGLLNVSQLPPLSKVTVASAANQAARLALTAQPGDIAIQTDNGQSYVLTASPASTNGNWQALVGSEAVVDTVEAALLAGTGLDKTYDDANGTITIDIDSTVATKTYADTAVSTHSADQTDVHGIANTALLLTTTGIESISNKTLATNLSANGFQVVGLAAPSGNSDAATKSYVDTSISNLVEAAPATLNTLNELAAALGDDAEFSTTVTNSIATKLPLAGGTMSGNINMGGTNIITNLPTPTNVGDVTSKSYVDGQITSSATTLTTAYETYANDKAIEKADAAEAAAISAAGLAAEDAIEAHRLDTTSIHGISDTANLAYQSHIDTHNLDTTNVHGIVDTAALITSTGVDTKISTAIGTEVTDRNAAISTAIGTEVNDRNTAIGTHSADTTSVHGIADTDALATKTYADGAVSTAVAALTKTSVGLANVDNTSDANKPVSVATQTALDLKANLDSPTFTGTVTLPANTISQSMMGDDSVGTNEIGGLAVTTGKIADLAVTEGKIADSAVTSAKIADGTIVNADINASAAIAQSKIADLTTDLAAKASLSGATFTGNVEMDGNLVVDGDFTVNGTNFSASATSITIEDNMLQLAHQNAANTVDLGLVVGYNDGAAKHAGLVRDVSDAKWKLFKGVTTEPSTTVDFTQGSLDDLEVAGFTASSATIGDVSNTELQYLNNVSSNIQTQLDAKLATATASTTYETITNVNLRAPKADPTFTGTVTVSASGVAFTDGTQTKEGVQSRTPIIQKTASYTLSALTERDSMIEMGSASALTLTVPTNATVAWPVGTSIDILQTGAGQVTIAGAGGVTVNGTPGLKLRTQWSGVTLFKRATDTWVVYGDLTA
jgi:hypothetical protein